MKSGRFVVIFQDLANIHLTKDVGGIPFALSKYWGIPHHFIGGKLTPTGEKFTRASFCDIPIKSIQLLGFLLTAARKVQSGDIVNIYHLSPLSAITIMTLRFVHGKGIKIYLKLDMDTRERSLKVAKMIAGKTPATSVREILTQKIGRWICHRVDVISAESSTVYAITSHWPSRVMLRVPNGFFEEDYAVKSKHIKSGRINRFVSVARHGSEQKRSEELLEAFSIANLPEDWTLSLVGDYTQKFKQLVDQKINNHPHLKNRILLHGPIHDRVQLMAALSSSKVFVAVSAYEGFSLALLEAAAYGCYCVSTNTGGASDVIGKNGILLNKAASASEIAASLESSVLASEQFDHCQFADLTAKRYSWKVVLTPLYEALQFHTADTI